jgi:hypothetical protein
VQGSVQFVQVDEKKVERENKQKTLVYIQERERSLQVTKTTYSGLQEHRSIVYTVTGQKAKPKVLPYIVHMSPETTDTGNQEKH